MRRLFVCHRPSSTPWLTLCNSPTASTRYVSPPTDHVSMLYLAALAGLNLSFCPSVSCVPPSTERAADRLAGGQGRGPFCALQG